MFIRPPPTARRGVRWSSGPSAFGGQVRGQSRDSVLGARSYLRRNVAPLAERDEAVGRGPRCEGFDETDGRNWGVGGLGEGRWVRGHRAMRLGWVESLSQEVIAFRRGRRRCERCRWSRVTVVELTQPTSVSPRQCPQLGHGAHDVVERRHEVTAGDALVGKPLEYLLGAVVGPMSLLGISPRMSVLQSPII